MTVFETTLRQLLTEGDKEFITFIPVLLFSSLQKCLATMLRIKKSTLVQMHASATPRGSTELTLEQWQQTDCSLMWQCHEQTDYHLPE